ncbi:protoheme IX farnesyltransferase, mitochondrial isoform 2-T2 [Spinachia spinachia]
MYKTPCSRLSGLVGVSLKQLVQHVPHCNQTARSLIRLHKRDPSCWLTYQHFNFLKRQYVTKNSSELHQRAAQKPSPCPTNVEERDDSVERRVQRIPTLDPVLTDNVLPLENMASKAPPGVSTSEPDAAVQQDSAFRDVGTPKETPHVHVETDEAREARLDRQWKQLKVDGAQLTDIYAKLAKIKLTALVVTSAAAGFAMAPVPFDPLTLVVASLGTCLASCSANSINQSPPRRVLCCGVWSSRSGSSHTGGQPADGLPGGPEHLPVHLLLHAAQEAQHRQHLGGSAGGRHTSGHGLDGRHRLPGAGCFADGWFPVLLAVPPLQRPQLELEGGLLSRRLPHDVRHSPGNVQARGPAPQPGPHRPVRRGAHVGRHHLDLSRDLAAHQPVHQLPGLRLLPPGRPRQRPQAVLLQPLAPAHAAAAGAHVQEAPGGRAGGGGGGGGGSGSALRTAELAGFQDA